MSIALPPQTRTAWRQAYEQVQQESNDNALFLLEDPFFQQVLELNIEGKPPIPIVAAFNRNTLCTAVSTLSHTQAAKTTELWVLLVLTTDFNEDTFTACITGNQLHYERHYYPGERNLALYRILPDTSVHADNSSYTDDTVFSSFIECIPEAGERLASPIAELKYLSDQDGGFWMRLGITMAQYQQKELAAAAFHKAAQTNLNAALRLLTLADQLQCSLDAKSLATIALNSPDIAVCEALQTFMQTAYYTNNESFIEAIGDISAAQAPCPESFIYKGIAAYKKEEYQQAVAWFGQYEELALKTPPEIIEAYAISLTESEDYTKAVDLLKSGIEKHPAYYWLYMRLGIAEAALGNHQDAVAALRISHEHAPENAYILYLMIESLVTLKEYNEAAVLALDPAIIPETDTWVLWARWRALTGAEQDQPAQEIFKQLTATLPMLQPFYQNAYIETDTDKLRELIHALEQKTQPVFPEVYMLLERL